MSGSLLSEPTVLSAVRARSRASASWAEAFSWARGCSSFAAQAGSTRPSPGIGGLLLRDLLVDDADALRARCLHAGDAQVDFALLLRPLPVPQGLLGLGDGAGGGEACGRRAAFRRPGVVLACLDEALGLLDLVARCGHRFLGDGQRFDVGREPPRCSSTIRRRMSACSSRRCRIASCARRRRPAGSRACCRTVVADLGDVPERPAPGRVGGLRVVVVRGPPGRVGRLGQVDLVDDLPSAPVGLAVRAQAPGAGSAGSPGFQTENCRGAVMTSS